ncbi:YcbK family protein [Pseudoroseomonas globiformis]|uniref:Murein endopeptidase K n=1 Tax=Teichococcus globiformis TaxID=2307229 RepID=A0ABV7FZQ1_9PROT
MFPRSLKHSCPCCDPTQFGRREVIAAGLGLLACAGASTKATAQPPLPSIRRLRVQRALTEDGFDGVYFREGRYDREALHKLDWVFRDLSAAEVTPMDPRLFDVLHAVAERLDSSEAYVISSGYRTPERNSALRTSRVSSVSLHMSGMAADFRLPGFNAYGVARLAAEMQVGGVGLYRRDGFVHLDCGPPRRW